MLASVRYAAAGAVPALAPLAAGQQPRASVRWSLATVIERPAPIANQARLTARRVPLAL